MRCVDAYSGCLTLLLIQEENFLRSAKISLKLFALAPSEAVVDRPYKKEKSNSIKLAFRSGGLAEFYQALNTALGEKAWTVVAMVGSDQIVNC